MSTQALTIRWRHESPVASYELRYGLAERPFGLTPDQRFLFRGRSFGQVLREVTQAVQRREGMVIVTGGSGTGKTMLCRTLLQHLDAPSLVSMVLDPRLTVEELLIQLLADFGVIRPGDGNQLVAGGGPSRHQLVTVLQRFLASLIPVNGSGVVIVDEAQQLSPDVLEQLRLLSNFETDDVKLLQVVLVGLPELDEVLKRPDMRHFDQRVARRCALEPLSSHEVQRYMDRRLSTARRLASTNPTKTDDSDVVPDVSLEIVRFTPAAMRSIARLSKGIPRAVNLLCDRSLEIGNELATATIGSAIVRTAAGRVTRKEVPAIVSGPTLRLAALAAAVAMLVGGSGAWLWASQWSTTPARSSTAKVEAPTGVVRSQPAHPALPAEARTLYAAGGVNIAVMSLETASEAAKVTDRLKQAGLPAFTRTQGEWHQIVVGPYISSDEAQQVQRALAETGFDDSRVFVSGGSSGASGVGSAAFGAAALDLRSTHALLVAAGDRVSLVLEMNGEPRQVLQRRVNDTTLEVDAGPVTAPLGGWQSIAPVGTALIQHVSLEEITSAGTDHYVRARLSLAHASYGNVRVVGRRVYVDVAPGPSTQADVVPAPKTPAPAAALQGAVVPRHDRPVTDINSAISRFEDIEPFLLSAVMLPEAPVLRAMIGTLADLSQAVRRTPSAGNASRNLLASAVAEAMRAVDPSFAGNRSTQAQHAIEIFREAKQRLQE